MKPTNINNNRIDRFFINMAIVKLDFDKKNNLLDNYMPLVFETLLSMDFDSIFSVTEFKEKFNKIADFEIPTAAAFSLINRAMKEYKVINKIHNGTYQINRDNIPSYKGNFSDIRDKEQKKYKILEKEFRDFCINHEKLEEIEDVSKYFFEILYDISPLLAKNISFYEDILEHNTDKKRFLVYKYIKYISQSNNEKDIASLQSLSSFVQGAMVTEFFYHPGKISDITDRQFKGTTIYFDTNFLIRILGFCSKEEFIPCQELMNMLKDTKVKKACFDITLNELKNIFISARNQLLKYHILKPKKIGDLFDYINENKIKASDIEIKLNKLEDELSNLDIKIIERKEIEHNCSLDEIKLNSLLLDLFPNQNDHARFHDIDCLQAIFQLRGGKNQKFLDNCKAIFITTNSKLAQESTLFFNSEYGQSDAPVCMHDSLFASFVWIKSIKRIANLPKERLVANSYAALIPHEKIWQEYLAEAEMLKNKGEITEEDYHLLVSSSFAREKLIDVSVLDENYSYGTVEDILSKIKREQTLELSKENEEYKKKDAIIDEKIEIIANKVSIFITSIIFLLIYTVIFLLVTTTLVQKLPEYLERWRTILYAITVLLGTISTFLGWSIIPFLRKIQKQLHQNLRIKIIEKIKSYLYNKHSKP